MPLKLTDAERDAIDALVRKIVTGNPAKVTYVEVTGEMRFPAYDQFMSPAELDAFRIQNMLQTAAV